MVRIIFILLFFCINTPLMSKDAFERNCVQCHKKLPTSLQKMFLRYLATYSGENSLKAELKHYLKYPSKETSVMQDMFLEAYGVKKPIKIDDKELDEAIDIYWDKYKVFGKLE
ncbi:MAG: hypothetical protein JXQ68_06275 [Campylobacterales bacterium]|nr:hypothetical protein [Campylobacterales bacterium]